MSRNNSFPISIELLEQHLAQEKTLRELLVEGICQALANTPLQPLSVTLRKPVTVGTDKAGKACQTREIASGGVYLDGGGTRAWWKLPSPALLAIAKDLQTQALIWKAEQLDKKYLPNL